jgi:hypothetical protein
VLSVTRGQAESIAAPASSSARVYSRNATGLVREVRLVDQIVYNLGSVTPLTSALAVGLFTIAAFPRMNIYVALLVPALMSVPLWITWSLLTATFPKTGGDYVFNSRILHPAVGFGVNLGFLFANVLTAAFAASFLSVLALAPTLLIIGTVTESETISGWADTFMIDNATGVFITSVVAILFVCALAAIRSRLLLRVMTVMVGIFAVAAIVDIIILFATSSDSFVRTFDSYAGSGAYDDVVAAGAGQGLYPSEDGYSTSSTLGAMFVWVGFSIFVIYGAYIAGEVRRAGDRRRMLTSIGGSGVLQTLFLLVSIIAFYSAVGEEFAISAVAGNQDIGIASFPYYAALATGSPVLAVIVAVAFLLWAIPTLKCSWASSSAGSSSTRSSGCAERRLARERPHSHAAAGGGDHGRALHHRGGVLLLQRELLRRPDAGDPAQLRRDVRGRHRRHDHAVAAAGPLQGLAGRLARRGDHDALGVRVPVGDRDRVLHRAAVLLPGRARADLALVAAGGDRDRADRGDPHRDRVVAAGAPVPPEPRCRP